MKDDKIKYGDMIIGRDSEFELLHHTCWVVMSKLLTFSEAQHSH
jgi:hypothetical protein